MKNLSDQEIISSIKKGNQADFSLIVDRYKDKAFSMLRRMLKNEMDAEEVLQDSFVKAYNALSSFRMDASFSTWFYKIVYNSALTVIANKKRKIELQMSSVDEHYDLSNEDDEVYSTTSSASEYILTMVEKLPPKYAVVLILFYIDNFSLIDISEVMGLSLVNVKVILHRARKQLKDLLVKHNYQEDILR